MLGFADAVLRDAELAGQIAGFVAGLAGDARVNSLGAKLVQLTMPGVADIYQGCELAGLLAGRPGQPAAGRLRRRRQLLAALDAGRPGRARRSLDADEAAGHLARAAAAPRASRLVRRATTAPLAAEGPAARHAVVVPAPRRRRGRPRGDRRHPAARRAAAPGRLGGHGAAAAGRRRGGTC